MIYFNLQLFGGKGGSTTVTTRDPTPEEKRITAQQADIIEHYAPNAIELNDIARDLLKDSYGTVQIDFNQLSQDAQNRINNALGGLSDLVGQNNAITADMDNNLRTAYDNYGLASMWNYDRYNDLGNRYDNATQDTNRELGNYINEIATSADNANSALNDYSNRVNNAASNTNNTLGNYINESGNAANRTNNILGNYINEAGNASNRANNALDNYKNSTDETTDKTNADLSEYINQNNRALGTVDGLLAGLQNGVLPSAYTQNMEDTIRGVLQKTMGENLNSMAQRGVINSSVNEAAQNAIASNAASAVAQNYINNLNTVGQFGQQRFIDNNATTSANAQMAQNQLDNVIKNADKGASLTQQQLNNIMGAIGAETGLIQQQYGNTRDAINTGSTLAQQQLGNTQNAINTGVALAQQQYGNAKDAANMGATWAQQQFGNTQNAINAGSTLAQQQLGNTSGMLGNLGQIYGQQYNDYTNAVGQQSRLAQQKGQNSLNANNQNASVYGNLISQASMPITTAAGAQEATTKMPMSFWNTSMGISNAGNSTLGALANSNQNQTTTKTDNSSQMAMAGGLLQGLGGLFGGLF